MGIVILWGLVVFLYQYYHHHHYHMQLRWKETLLNRAKHILAQRRSNVNPNRKNQDDAVATTARRQKDGGDDKDANSKPQEGDNGDEPDGAVLQKNQKQDSSEGRESQKKSFDKLQVKQVETDKLRQLFMELDRDMRENSPGGIRWTPDHLLRELPGQEPNHLLAQGGTVGNVRKKLMKHFKAAGMDFGIKRKKDPPMAWEGEWEQLSDDVKNLGPKVDYTKHNYSYPTIESPPPEGYPELEPMRDMLTRWPQDSVDDPPSLIVEKLMRFDYSDPHQRQMAEVYRNAELPFKVYNVPEVIAGRCQVDRRLRFG